MDKIISTLLQIAIECIVDELVTKDNEKRLNYLRKFIIVISAIVVILIAMFIISIL